MRTANASYKRAARANERYAREEAKRRHLNLKEQIETVAKPSLLKRTRFFGIFLSED